MTPADELRLPTIWDCSQEKYKDWLHLNLFDFQSGIIALINASLHGSPQDLRSRVIGTAVANVPGLGWVGNLEVLGFSQASITPLSIGLPRVALAFDQRNDSLSASVRDAAEEWAASFSALPESDAIDIEAPLPLGDGWISWRVVPRLQATGTCTVAGRHLNLEQTGVYHDHNWGRWFWGDDFGWEWGCFSSQDAKASFVVARTTDRSHTKRNSLSLIIDLAGEQRMLSDASIDLELSGSISVSRRLPGAMAALYQDMAFPNLPGCVNLRANDGLDEFAVEFTARDALQLIASDPIAPNGVTFIHEIAGEFSYSAILSDQRFIGTGLGVFEYVG